MIRDSSSSFGLAAFVVLASCAPLALLGCDCSGGATPARTCTSSAQCTGGEQCIDGRCAAPRDAGGGGIDGGRDAAGCPSRSVCGAACCALDETCAMGDVCCAATDVCGGVCCGGADQSCVAGTCVLDCGAASACGDPGTAVCCPAGDACVEGVCTTPTQACTSALDCPEGQYCELSVGGCLPRRTDLPVCEYHPTTGAFDLAVEWHWSSDPTVMPLHDQVMSAPMVANLNDDNGDGAIDENDIPDVVFNTYRIGSPDTGGASIYNADGVLRAINGNDGSRLWPTATPAYRTNPGLEVAIADVDASSPGPEIIGCTFPPGTTYGTARLTLFRATGEILRRFDTAPADVACGRPSVADMNGDGIAEIAVGNTIVQADGTGAVTAMLDTSTAIPVLYDVDDDGVLDFVGINGVARRDGTMIWHDPLFAGEAGYTAVADVDLDGDPDVVATSVQSHQVVVWDAATGARLAGPVEITPTADPTIAARVASVMAANPTRDALDGGGPPTIANFDDDPEPEIALAGGYAYVIFEHDLTRKWYDVTQDTSSRATGSSVFDFEGDGIAEVLYNDELVFRAYRGPTGDEYLQRCNTSGTLTEYPIVVDVDNDDHAEIVLVENDYAFHTCADGSASSHGVWAFGHPMGQWVRTRRIWNEHAYHVTNINEDGTLPAHEAPNFSSMGLNDFRQNVQPDGLFDAPDLVLRDLSFATSQCGAALLLRVRVVNEGRAGAPAGVPVSFYVDDVWVGATPTMHALVPGASEVVELRFSPVEADTVYAVRAVVNDAAHAPLTTLNQCREDNDMAGPISAACPGVM
ncbi:MAG: hypothetical protein U0234_07990 [Sandaracinus sp.]